MPKLTLGWYQWGLVVTGDTFAVKDVLKGHAGKWDPPRKGWLFESGAKAGLMDALHAALPDVKVEDKALAILEITSCDEGLLVIGETFPVRGLLKTHEGRWQKDLNGWVFPISAGKALRAALAACPDVGEVADRALGGKAKKPLALEDAAPKAAPGRPGPPAGGPGGRGGAAALALRGPATPSGAAALRGGVRVEEVATERRQAKRCADGTQEHTVTQAKKRRLSCKTTGRPVEEQSVTKRRQVRETADEVIETSTITVTRVRRKSS